MCRGSPDPRSVNSRDVYLHPHQPDPPNKCGCGTHEARGEAFRNRLLQKQSRRLAERRVSHPLPPGPGRSGAPPRRPASGGRTDGPGWGLVGEGTGKLFPCWKREESLFFPGLAPKPGVPFFVWVVFWNLVLLCSDAVTRNLYNYALFARIMIKAKSLVLQILVIGHPVSQMASSPGPPKCVVCSLLPSRGQN